MAVSAEPISPAEGDRLIDAAIHALGQALGRRDYPPNFGLAVSGGPDSLALLALVADWATRQPEPQVASERVNWVVLTVDHGLRAASADEARHVAAIAARFGLRHETLQWTGEKPSTGIMAAARAARYDLFRQYAAQNAVSAIFTAHVLEDQAETLLMRLARGSGIDGLASMQPVSSLKQLRLVRPLLEVPKARLLATLRERGIDWIEDPTNRDQAYERTRWRERLPELSDMGLTTTSLGRSARRMARAAHALDVAASNFLKKDNGCCGAQLGYASFSLAEWQAQLEDLKVRVLAALVRDIGGDPTPATMTQIEDAIDAINAPTFKRMTLARCLISAEGDRLLLMREPDRAPLPRIMLNPGEVSTWDNRFSVCVEAVAARPLAVRALGADGLAVPMVQAALVAAQPLLPAPPLKVLPSFWDGDMLVGVPSLTADIPNLSTHLSGKGTRAMLKGPCTARVTALDMACQWSIQWSID